MIEDELISTKQVKSIAYVKEEDLRAIRCKVTDEVTLDIFITKGLIHLENTT